MTEFVIILPVLMLMIFGALQFALIYNAKNTLNFATFEATRAGTLHNGSYDAVYEGFARGLAPLYTHDNTVDAVHAARDKIRNEPQRVCIERINPPSTAFQDFAVWNNDDNTDEIPSDNLMYRDPTPGNYSRLSPQDATLLKVRISYCYKMVVPVVNKTIGYMLTGQQDPLYNPKGDNRQGYGTKGHFRWTCLHDLSGIPIQSQAILRMQSPVREDPAFRTDCD